jgi:phospholipid/cholesterol/gamma-HCH transport system substrate-binding protein
MTPSRLEWRVGLFVAIGLALLAILLIQFSKGASVFRPKYTIILRSENVSGLKNRADVLMSGVKVGSVSEIVLAPDGKSVAIELTIYSRYQIHKDARFTIEQAGFLGDQYIAVTPTENKADAFVDGEEAKAEAPFNFQEVARSASGLVAKVETTAATVNQMLTEMRQYLLNPHTMTNISLAVSNMRSASESAVLTMDNINVLLATNAPSISQSTSNLAQFSATMNDVADSLNSLVATNQGKVASAISNIDASAASLRSLMADVDAGKGLAGNLVRNEELSRSVSQITRNLSVTSSNLNRLGLWGIMWKRRETKPPSPPPDRIISPKEAARTGR